MPRPPAAPSQPSMAHLNRQSTSSSTSSLENSNEIVARDQTGTYKTDIPTLPSLSPTGGQVHAAQLPVDVEVELTANRSDKDKLELETSLVEMMCRNHHRQMSSEPAEILSLIHQSLRNRVASLDEDNWMYEPEQEPRS